MAEVLLISHAKGELGDEEAQAVERHVAACPSCQRRLANTRRMLDVLNQAREPDTEQLLAEVLGLALSTSASDIHVEPEADHVRIRLRVDGALHEVKRLPRPAHAPLMARLHVMCDTDPLQSEVPQFARLHLKLEAGELHARVAVCPTYWGPRATIRVFPEDPRSKGLTSSWMSDPIRETLLSWLRSPCGLIAIAGPAGAGRTSTAYACLDHVRDDSVSVFTVEDPIHLVLEGITPIALDPRAGLDYPTALRAVLRSDPDVIYVADLADRATIAAACDAAVTGHLVIGCLYANDAPGAVARLMHTLGDGYLLGEALLGVLAQRLVRKVCTACAETYELPDAELAFLRAHGVSEPPATALRGAGCESCRGTGYFGRTAIHEVLPVSEALVSSLADDAYTPELGAIQMTARLADDGIAKAFEGVTPLREVDRVTRMRSWLQ